MAFEALQSGSVFTYPFLWAHQHERGETEGRKPRPVAVALRLPRSDGDGLVLLAITTRNPAGRISVEIPRAEKRRAGLNPDTRCWIMLDEYNTDVVGKSYYLVPDPPLGAFSSAFFLPVARRFAAGIRAAKRTDRS